VIGVLAPRIANTISLRVNSRADRDTMAKLKVVMWEKKQKDEKKKRKTR
jgi:hypothetical protein